MTDKLNGWLTAARAVYETLAISAPTVVDEMRSRMTVERGNTRLAAWSRRLVEQAEIQLGVSGREHIEPGQAYLIMSNHQSHYDIPVVFQSFPGPVRMVTKTELFRVPIWGRAMTATGFIEVDRSNRERAIASLRAARERFAEGISVWIAPEGTRSRTGELLPFKKGGFVLAMDMAVPILPVGIAGSRDILLPDTAAIRRGVPVHVSFHPPIAPPAADAGTAARDALMATVRAAIERSMDASRSALARRATSG